MRAMRHPTSRTLAASAATVLTAVLAPAAEPVRLHGQVGTQLTVYEAVGYQAVPKGEVASIHLIRSKEARVGAKLLEAFPGVDFEIRTFPVTEVQLGEPFHFRAKTLGRFEYVVLPGELPTAVLEATATSTTPRPARASARTAARPCSSSAATARRSSPASTSTTTPRSTSPEQRSANSRVLRSELLPRSCEDARRQRNRERDGAVLPPSVHPSSVVLELLEHVRSPECCHGAGDPPSRTARLSRPSAHVVRRPHRLERTPRAGNG